MKKSILTFTAIFFIQLSFAQCPDVLHAMINSCGVSEGNNEFVVFTTAVSDSAKNYTLNYGTAIPPNTNHLAGSDATTKTGTGTVSGAPTCAVVEVTSGATVIPAGARVIFIPASYDQQYDLSGLCNGSNSIYVVYIKTNTAGGTNSNWTTGGTFANSASTPRYFQISEKNNSSCDTSNAPIKSYIATGNWTANTNGNFVSWNGTNAVYGNNGCTSIVLPITFLYINAAHVNENNIINWKTSQEINTAYFDVERSYDGNEFIKVGAVSAAGQSNTIQSYLFKDPVFQFRPTFYRIKSVDLNAQFSFSKIVKVYLSTDEFKITNIYPTPASNQLNIEWNSSSNGQSKLLVMDIAGKLLQSEHISVLSGYNKYTLNVAKLAHGKYLLKIISNQTSMTGTFVK